MYDPDTPIGDEKSTLRNFPGLKLVHTVPRSAPPWVMASIVAADTEAEPETLVTTSKGGRRGPGGSVNPGRCRVRARPHRELPVMGN